MGVENPANRTLVCSVLFLDIVEYSRMPVADQLQTKQAFNAALATALEQVASRDRVILDTGDGAAITFMGDPEDALFAAISMRDAAAAVPIRLGINLGPVRLVKDLNRQMNVIGDGINVAQRVMSFAQPGQLLVSRSFYEVVSCLSRDYLKLFQHEGSRTDKHVREHDVYSVLTEQAKEAPAAERAPQPAVANAANWLAGKGPLGMKRSVLAGMAAAFIILLTAGVFLRLLAGAPLVTAAVTQPSVMKTEPSAAAEPKARASSSPREKKAPGTKLASVTERKTVSRDGRVEVTVSPWGEVVVDGRGRGMSPQVLSLAAGPHTIEIRNSSYPIHVERVEVKAGQALKIQHTFY
jgi:class 3 adenylate cyclase